MSRSQFCTLGHTGTAGEQPVHKNKTGGTADIQRVPVGGRQARGRAEKGKTTRAPGRSPRGGAPPYRLLRLQLCTGCDRCSGRPPGARHTESLAAFCKLTNQSVVRFLADGLSNLSPTDILDQRIGRPRRQTEEPADVKALRQSVAEASTNTKVMAAVREFLQKSRYGKREYLRDAMNSRRRGRMVPMESHPRDDGAEWHP